MKEITRIITAQITIVEKMPDDVVESIAENIPDAVKHVKADLAKKYLADDVNVVIQDFVMDK